jgi:hypothetical protein
MLLERGWLHTEAIWTNELPFVHGSQHEPYCALLSAEGEVLFKSPALPKRVNVDQFVYSHDLMEQIEQPIAAEVERRRKGPQDASPALRGAYELFGKGQVARAFAALAELGGGEAAARARGDFERRLGRRLDQAAWLVDHGELGAAEEMLGPYQDSLPPSRSSRRA